MGREEYRDVFAILIHDSFQFYQVGESHLMDQKLHSSWRRENSRVKESKGLNREERRITSKKRNNESSEKHLKSKERMTIEKVFQRTNRTKK